MQFPSDWKNFRFVLHSSVCCSTYITLFIKLLQFVNFTDIMSTSEDVSKKEAAFALAALMEIPAQYKWTQGLRPPEYLLFVIPLGPALVILGILMKVFIF